MTVTKSSVPSNNAADFDSAWEGVRADKDIQFAPIKAPEQPEMPEWLQDLLEFLGRIAEPLVNAIAIAWPALRIVLLVLLAIGVLALLWVLIRPHWYNMRDRNRTPLDDEWRPDEHVARALLDDADRLAAQGRFDEAAHLLLFRSIEDIQRRRPHSLRPSHTAREIGALESLSDTAKSAFAVISGYVEASFFARRPLDAAAWTHSRDAYSQFALDKR